MRHEPVACPAFAKKGPRFTGLNSIDTTFYIQLSELIHAFPCYSNNCKRFDSSDSPQSTASDERREPEFEIDTKTQSDIGSPDSLCSREAFNHSDPTAFDASQDVSMSPPRRPRSDPLTVPDSPSSCRPKFNIKSIVREGNLFLFHLIAGEVTCSESADSLTKELVSYLSSPTVSLLGVSRVYKCDVELSYDFERQLTSITRLRLVHEET